MKYLILILFLTSCASNSHTMQELHKSSQSQNHHLRDSTFIHHITHTNTINDTVHHNTHHYHYNSSHTTDTIRLTDTIHTQHSQTITKSPPITSSLKHYIIIAILLAIIFLHITKKP